MSVIRYNQWLHNSGTGGVSQDAGGNIGIGTTAPLIPVGAGNTAILNVGVVTCNSIEVTGNVSVGGTLTYQDVTNIDSVGLITARAGIIDSTLTAGRVVYVDSDKSLTDSGNLTFNGSDLLIDASTNAYKGVKFDNSFNLTFGSSSGSSPRLYLKGTSNSQSDSGDTFLATGTGGEQIFRSNTFTKFEVNADSTTAEALRITSGGKTILHGGGATGANNTATILENGNTLNIHGTSSSDGISVVRYSANYGAYGINIGKSRNSTFGTNTLVQDGNELGHISFYGADGTNFEMAAQITGLVDGDPATGGDGTDMPGALSFRTTNDGSNSPTEKLRIKSSGEVLISKTGTNAKVTLSRNESVGTDNAVTGVIDFANNTAHTVNARIMARTSGTGNVGGQLVIETRDESDSVLRERFHINKDGKVVIRSQGATASDGYAALEIRQNTGGKHLVLATNSATSSTNEVMLGFKLHPSSDDERVKAAIICRGTGSNDYGQPSRMSFCLDPSGDNASATISADEKMRIDSSGYVTTPYNPKFWYSALSNTSSSGGTSNTEILKFSTERHNQGSNYNASNGRFTAPVAGTYWFSFNGLVDNSGSNSHYWAQLWRNGSQVSNIGYTFSNNGEYEYFGGSACIYLAKDDYAQIYASANIHDGNETSFSGFLIG